MKWIRTKDELPEYNKKVFLNFPQYKGHPIGVGYRDYTNSEGENYIFEEDKRKDASHWAEIEPPQ